MDSSGQTGLIGTEWTGLERTDWLGQKEQLSNAARMFAVSSAYLCECRESRKLIRHFGSRFFHAHDGKVTAWNKDDWTGLHRSFTVRTSVWREATVGHQNTPVRRHAAQTTRRVEYARILAIGDDQGKATSDGTKSHERLWPVNTNKKGFLNDPMNKESRVSEFSLTSVNRISDVPECQFQFTHGRHSTTWNQCVHLLSPRLGRSAYDPSVVSCSC